MVQGSIGVRAGDEDKMIVVNFAHPLTALQLSQVETLTGSAVERVIAQALQFDNTRSFVSQAEAILLQVPLTSEEWQSIPILIVLPALNFIAALLLTELHAHMGHFPAIVRLRPVEGIVPLQYEVAEIIDLQRVRDGARLLR
jgi:hypothetical protein